MTVVPLLAVGIVMNLVAALFVLSTVVLILVVLIQKGRGGGLSGAFGGGMASNLLGSKTGDFLTWATITLVAVYLVLAVVLGRYYKPTVTEYGAPGQTSKMAQPAPQEKGPAAQPRSSSPSAGTDQGAPPAQPPAGTDTGAGQSQPPAQPPAGTSPDTGAGATPEPNAAKG